MIGRLVVVMLAVALSACTESSPLEPTEPEVVDVGGVWEGPVQEEYGGTGQLRMEIANDPFGFAGTFTFSFEDPSRNRSGTIRGDYATEFLPSQMSLQAIGEPCEAFPEGIVSHLIFNWVVEAGRLKASYLAGGCLGGEWATSGSFDLARLE